MKKYIVFITLAAMLMGGCRTINGPVIGGAIALTTNDCPVVSYPAQAGAIVGFIVSAPIWIPVGFGEVADPHSDTQTHPGREAFKAAANTIIAVPTYLLGGVPWCLFGWW